MKRRLHIIPIRLAAAMVLAATMWAGGAEAAALPMFHVPGFEEDITAINDLHALHHEAAFTSCTLWDAWLPMSTLWASEKKRGQYRAVFLDRHIDGAGYVSMQQHRGLAHPGGWPFPTWPQSGGIGWHFTHAGDSYAQHLKVPLASLEYLALDGVGDARIDPNHGLRFSTQGPWTMLTSPVPIRVDAAVAPFVVIEWSGVPPDATPRLEWTADAAAGFGPGRSVPVPLENARPGHALHFSAVPVHRHPAWQGHITGLRLIWENAGSARDVTIRAIHTAVDSRHPTTNSLFILGFSFHDLMARLKTKGPDDAWMRLREILAWYREVRAEGGYRAYYAKSGRGTLQGGGPAGGLGMDREFMESVLVPQVMLYGFLGFHPTAGGYEVHPRLPKEWPSLTINGIRFQNQILDITAHAGGRVEVKPRNP